MKSFKRAVIAMVTALAFAGVYGALRNLPVASGCGFYSKCPEVAVEKSAVDALTMSAASDAVRDLIAP